MTKLVFLIFSNISHVQILKTFEKRNHELNLEKRGIMVAIEGGVRVAATPRLQIVVRGFLGFGYFSSGFRGFFGCGFRGFSGGFPAAFAVAFRT